MYQTPLQDDIVDALAKGSACASVIAHRVHSTTVCVKRAVAKLQDRGLVRTAGWEVDRGYRRLRFELVVDFRQPQRSQP